MSYVVLNWYY